jgi:hypothetical protein
MCGDTLRKLIESAKALLRQDSQNQKPSPYQPTDSDNPEGRRGAWCPLWRSCSENPNVNHSPTPPAGDQQERAEHQKNERATTRASVTIADLTKVLAGAAIASTFISAGSLWVIKGQLNEMVSSGEDTKTLINASKTQADAAKKQAEAAATSAETARQAMLYAQRAWVGPVDARIDGKIEAGKDTTVVVSLRNTGREPALNVSIERDPFVITKEEDRNGIGADRMNRKAYPFDSGSAICCV